MQIDPPSRLDEALKGFLWCTCYAAVGSFGTSVDPHMHPSHDCDITWHAWTLEKGAGAQSEQAKGQSAGKDGVPAADVVASMMQGGGEGERASGLSLIHI